MEGILGDLLYRLTVQQDLKAPEHSGMEPRSSTCKMSSVSVLDQSCAVFKLLSSGSARKASAQFCAIGMPNGPVQTPSSPAGRSLSMNTSVPGKLHVRYTMKRVSLLMSHGSVASEVASHVLLDTTMSENRWAL